MSIRILSVAGLALIVPACHSDTVLFSAHRVKSQPEAGSVHFAVLSVAPWEEYVRDLQPGFDLDAEQALAKVLPSTRGQQDWMLRVAELLAGVRSTRKLERSRERASRQGAQVETELPDAVELPEESQEAEAIVVPDGSSEEEFGERYLREAGYGVADPMTLYWAATALYQEVKLLNRYIEDAAVLRGYRPYVVRMQVGLMPLARGEPYDAYSTISFFCCPRDGAQPGEPGESGERTVEGGDDQVRALPDMPAQPFAGPGPRNAPKVVPLMASDNLEASSQSRTHQAIRQFALALDYFASGLTGAASAQDLSSRVQQVLGHDLNSLLSVMRVSDNSLRVRLGAQQQGSSNFAMVPRNHNITVLVMLPEGSGSTVQVVAKTTMVDAETGAELPERAQADYRRRMQAIIDFHELDGFTPADMEELLRHAQMNDQQGFERAFERLLVPAGTSGSAGAGNRQLPHHAYAKALWLDLVALMVGSQYTATEFDVPPGVAPTPELVPDCVPRQTALVFDASEVGTTVVLEANGAPSVPVEEIRASLVVRKQGSEEVRLAPVPVEFDFERTELRSRFPSLTVLGLASGGKASGALVIELDWGGGRAEFAGLYVAGTAP